MHRHQRESTTGKIKPSTEKKQKLPIIELSDCSSSEANNAIEQKGAVGTSMKRKPERVPIRIISKKRNQHRCTRQQKRVTEYLVEWDDRSRTWETVLSITKYYPMIVEFEMNRNISREMREFSANFRKSTANPINKQIDSCRKVNANVDDSAVIDNDSQIASNEKALQTAFKNYQPQKLRHCTRKNYLKVRDSKIYERHENDDEKVDIGKQDSRSKEQQKNIKLSEIERLTKSRVEEQYQNVADEAKPLMQIGDVNLKDSEQNDQCNSPTKVIHFIELSEDGSFLNEAQPISKSNEAESQNKNSEKNHRVDSEVASSESNQCTFIMNFEDLNMPLFPSFENEEDQPNANNADRKLERNNVDVIIADKDKNGGEKKGENHQSSWRKKEDTKPIEYENEYSKIHLGSRISKVLRKFSSQNMIKQIGRQTARKSSP